MIHAVRIIGLGARQAGLPVLLAALLLGFAVDSAADREFLVDDPENTVATREPVWVPPWLFPPPGPLAVPSESEDGASPLASSQCLPPPSVTRLEDGHWYEIGEPTFYGSAGVFDPIRRRVLAINSGGIWSLSTGGVSSWAPVIPIGEALPSVDGWPMCYDAASDRFLLIGPSGPYSDPTQFLVAWEIQAGTVTRVARLPAASAVPRARQKHTAAIDSKRNRLLVFGGRTGEDCCVRRCDAYGCFCEFPCPVYGNDVLTLSLTGSPTWSVLQVSGTAPLGREGASSVYDPVGDRFLIMGGGFSGEYRDIWALELSGTPRWSQITPSGTGPASLRFCTPQFDPWLNRMLLVESDGSRLKLWALRFDGTPAWELLNPGGELPAPRQGQFSALDSIGRDFLVLGGQVSSNPGGGYQGAWALGLAPSSRWRRIGRPFATHPGYFGHTLHLDSKRGRVLLFGGATYTGQYYLSQTVWQLGAGGWSKLAVTGSISGLGRHAHAAIYDSLRDRLVVVGGGAATQPGVGVNLLTNDTWELSLSGSPTWRQLNVGSLAPSPRLGHGVIYDSREDRLVLFGGRTSTEYLNDVWSLSLSGEMRWKHLDPIGDAPRPRAIFASAYDERRRRMIVSSGVVNDQLDRIGDAWALELDGPLRWTPIAPSVDAPVARYWATATYDSKRGHVLLVGGLGAPYGSTCDLDDTWALTEGDSARMEIATGALEGVLPRPWTQLAPTGTRPVGIYGHASVFDPASNRLICTGGQSGGGRTTWALDFNSPLQAVVAENVARLPTDPAESDPGLKRTLAPAAVRGSTSAGILEPALRAVESHGSPGEMWVRIDQPNSDPASLELFDLSGRRLKRMEVGRLGAGTHSIHLAARGELAAGIYWVRFVRLDRLLSRRFVCVP